MKRHYMVGIREVHVRLYSVKAENEDAAKELVNRRDPSVVDEDFTEYSHELNQDTWSVEEIPAKDTSPGPRQEGTQP
jgi:hypothetical protein